MLLWLLDVDVVDADGAAEVLLFGRDGGGAARTVRVADYMPGVLAFLQPATGPDARIVAQERTDELAAETRAVRAAVAERRRSDGFRRELGLFAELRFASLAAQRAARRRLEGRGLPLCAAFIDVRVQFLADAGLTAQAWARVGPQMRDLGVVAEADEPAAPPALVALAWDIEQLSAARGAGGEEAGAASAPAQPARGALAHWFPARAPAAPKQPAAAAHSAPRPMPDATRRADRIIAISLVAWRLGAGATPEAVLHREVLCLKDPGGPEGEARTTAFAIGPAGADAAERALLEAFAARIRALDPDVLVTYNGNTFDVRCLATRARLLGAAPAVLGALAARAGASARARERTVPTAIRELFVLDHPGRVHVDLYHALETVHRLRLPSMKLGAVAAHVLGGDAGKVDLPIERMFTLWEEGTPAGVREMCRYADMDAFLLVRLTEKLSTFHAAAELARVANVPVAMKLVGGMQLLTTAQLFHQMRALAPTPMAMMPAPPPLLDAAQLGGAGKDKGKGKGKRKRFEGGRVLAPVPGVHAGVVVVDCNSMYPSVIQGLGLDPSSLVLSRAELAPDALVLIFRADRAVPRPVPVADGAEALLDLRPAAALRGDAPPPGEVWFRWRPAHALPLPELLRETLAQRKAVRGQIAALDAARRGTIAEVVLQQRQLALKAMANSHYGALTSATGAWPQHAVGMCVPGFGRFVLDVARALAEELGERVVYGDTDSIMIAGDAGGAAPGTAAYARARFAKAWRVAAAIGEAFAVRGAPAPPRFIAFEPEKLYVRFAIGAQRKLYAGAKVMEGDIPAGDADAGTPCPGALECRGLPVVRTDVFPVYRKMALPLLEAVLVRGDAPAGLAGLSEALAAYGAGDRARFPLADFVLAQTLSRSEYAGANPPAHVVVARRAAGEGAPLRRGARVQYVICRAADVGGAAAAGAALGARCFPPEEAEARGWAPDVAYYFAHKLREPLLSLVRLLALPPEAEAIVAAAGAAGTAGAAGAGAAGTLRAYFAPRGGAAEP